MHDLGVSSSRNNGNHPLSEIIHIMHAKSKALQSYERCLADWGDSGELREAFEKIRREDRQHFEMLKNLI